MHLKDFDSWNNHKKRINSGSGKLYHVRDIWWCYLGLNVGFEQDGTGAEYQRPVLIVKSLSKQTCFVLPLTTSPSQNRYRIRLGMVGEKEAFAILSQLRTIDTKRLINKIMVLNKERFGAIQKAIKILF